MPWYREKVYKVCSRVYQANIIGKSVSIEIAYSY
jgi:hypothetical protein